MSNNALAAGIRHLRGRMAAQGRSDESDEQLLHAFIARHDEDAFAVLVRRHGPMVLRVCHRVLGQHQDAEDAFQAVFLLLARNAAGLRKKTALAGFLHGAAYRIALTARRSAARRRKHEGSLGALTQPCSPADPMEELSWREVRVLLDEEIARLPEKYRTVFVLCCLEELSQAEAARHLGVNERTLSNRLMEARKRLGRRLARGGVELASLLAATEVVAQPASALPVGLMATTTKAVLATAGGDGLAGVVSASVAELVQSAATAMMVSKAKTATIVLLALSILSCAGWWTYCDLTVHAVARNAEPPAVEASDELKATPPQREMTETMEIQGRVLGPDGKPKAEAKLLLLGKKGKIKQLGATRVDGCFTVAVPKEPRLNHSFCYLVAQADGFGIDFIDLSSTKGGRPVELRLVRDNIVHGRVVNTEGKPVAGVRVVAQTLSVYIGNSLDTFLAAYIRILAGGQGHDSQKVLWYGAEALFHATTDAEGRFALAGIGAERTADLRLSGGGIADTTLLYVVNRAGFDPKPYNQAFRDYFTRANGRKDQRWMSAHLLSAPDISVVA